MDAIVPFVRAPFGLQPPKPDPVAGAAATGSVLLGDFCFCSLAQRHFKMRIYFFARTPPGGTSAIFPAAGALVWTRIQRVVATNSRGVCGTNFVKCWQISCTWGIANDIMVPIFAMMEYIYNVFLPYSVELCFF